MTSSRHSTPPTPRPSAPLGNRRRIHRRVGPVLPRPRRHRETLRRTFQRTSRREHVRGHRIDPLPGPGHRRGERHRQTGVARRQGVRRRIHRGPRPTRRKMDHGRLPGFPLRARIERGLSERPRLDDRQMDERRPKARTPKSSSSGCATRTSSRAASPSPRAIRRCSSGGQIIGWNPKLGKIVSMHFDAKGGFGNDVWIKDGRNGSSRPRAVPRRQHKHCRQCASRRWMPTPSPGSR